MTILDSLKLKGKQADAAKTRARDVSVSAGAGSGKTLTLVARYLSLLDEGHPPSTLVAITFTEKAAREMRNRIRAAIHRWTREECPADEHTPWQTIEADIDTARIGTIHSLCASLLRAHPAEAQVDPRFGVLEEAQSAALKAQIVEDTLTWSVDQPDLVPLYQSFETGQLAEILRILLQKRLDCPSALSAEKLVETWLAAIAASIERFGSCAAVSTAISELEELIESADLLSDAGPNLANQVEGLMAQWRVITSALAQRDGIQAAQALYVLRREHCDGRTGKKGSRAKAAVATLRGTFDETVQLWLGGKSKEDSPPDRAVESQTAQLVPLLLQMAQHAFTEYLQAKERRQSLDFDDLEAGAVSLLQDKAIRARWQQQIHAVLVDEFQDTNERQRQIVESLAGVRDGKTGRLFIVGDAKQSIYRFRGADVAVFRRLDKDIRERGGLPLEFDVTYRAHRPLVNALNEILGTLMPADSDAPPYAVPFAPLTAEHDRPKTPVTAPFVEYLCGLGATADQAQAAAAELLAERLAGLECEEKIPWDHIALLFRASTGFPEYEAALERHGIPFVTVAGRGFYDRPEIRDLLNILRALADPWDDLAQAGLLRSPAFGLSDTALYLLRRHNGSEPTSYQAALAGDLAYLAEPDRDRAEWARDKFASLRTFVDRVPVAELLKKVLDDTHYRAILCAERAGTRLLRNVDKLLADAHASGIVRVAEFLEYIEALQGAGAREGEAASEAEGAVRLMTVHKAKGLQFPVVVLADAGRGRPPFRQPVVITSEFGLVPDPGRLEASPITFRLAKQLEREQSDAEDERLLYVAATRAQDKLIICGHQQNKTSAWLNRLTAAAGIDLALLPPTGEWQTATLLQSQESVRGRARTETPQTEEAQTPGESESAPTALSSPMTAPSPMAGQDGKPLFEPVVVEASEEIDPKERSDTRVQQRLRRATGRFRRADGTVVGTLVHAALAQWRFPGDQALESLLHASAREEGVVEPEELQTTLDEAIELLDRFHADPRWQEINHATLRRHEVPFTYAVNGRVSTGYIDLLYRDDQGCWQIVEFKTDPVQNEEQLCKLVDEYKKQVRRYQAAVERLLGTPAEARLCFLNDAGTVRWEEINEPHEDL